jgi:hypothetical protein
VSRNSLDFEDFVIEPVSGDIPHHKAALALAAGQDPLGPLGKLRCTFKGTGFKPDLAAVRYSDTAAPRSFP